MKGLCLYALLFLLGALSGVVGYWRVLKHRVMRREPELNEPYGTDDRPHDDPLA